MFQRNSNVTVRQRGLTRPHEHFSQETLRVWTFSQQVYRLPGYVGSLVRSPLLQKTLNFQQANSRQSVRMMPLLALDSPCNPFHFGAREFHFRRHIERDVTCTAARVSGPEAVSLNPFGRRVAGWLQVQYQGADRPEVRGGITSTGFCFRRGRQNQAARKIAAHAFAVFVGAQEQLVPRQGPRPDRALLAHWGICTDRLQPHAARIFGFRLEQDMQSRTQLLWRNRLYHTYTLSAESQNMLGSTSKHGKRTGRRAKHETQPEAGRQIELSAELPPSLLAGRAKGDCPVLDLMHSIFHLVNHQSDYETDSFRQPRRGSFSY